MKIEILRDNGNSVFRITYEQGEWALVENKLRELGLQRARTTKGFACELNLDYYKDTAGAFRAAVAGGNSNIIDDINAPFSTIRTQTECIVNISVLRVVPANDIVSIPITAFMTAPHVTSIIDALTTTLRKTFELVTSATVDVKFNIPENRTAAAAQPAASSSETTPAQISTFSDVEAVLTLSNIPTGKTLAYYKKQLYECERRISNSTTMRQLTRVRLLSKISALSPAIAFMRAHRMSTLQAEVSQ